MPRARYSTAKPSMPSDESDEQQPLAVEQVAHDHRADQQEHDEQQPGDQRSEQGGAPDDRTGAEPPGAAGRQGPAHFLLDGQEEPGPDDEHQGPQHRQRRVRRLAERPRRDHGEAVRGDPRDDEPDADLERAFRQRVRSAGAVEDAAAQRSSRARLNSLATVVPLSPAGTHRWLETTASMHRWRISPTSASVRVRSAAWSRSR